MTMARGTSLSTLLRPFTAARHQHCLIATLSSLSIERIRETSVDLRWSPDATAMVDTTGKGSNDNGRIDRGTFHYTWLRDNCQCRLCVDPSTRQKLHSSADVSTGVKPVDVRIVNPGGRSKLALTWASSSMRVLSPASPHASSASAVHESEYDVDWLARYNYKRPTITTNTPTTPKPYPLLWDTATLAKNRTPFFDYTQTTSDSQTRHKFLTEMRNLGIGILRGVPTQDKQVEQVANMLGCIRETFYGRSWDVRSVPDAKNIAYTSIHLGLHMDLMYFEAPPGIQFLHCLKNTVTGGSSIFVDVFRAVEILKQEHPDHYDILTQMPVTFHYVNDGHHMHYRHPTIDTSDVNHGTRVYYAPPFQGPLEWTGSPDMIDKFYTAFKTFDAIVNRPDMVFETTLQPGDCAVFLNRRVLHGRKAFDAVSGTRHLKGTYVDLDEFNDTLRVHGLM